MFARCARTFSASPLQSAGDFGGGTGQPARTCYRRQSQGERGRVLASPMLYASGTARQSPTTGAVSDRRAVALWPTWSRAERRCG